MASKTFATQCSFTDRLKKKIVNQTIATPQQVLANCKHISPPKVFCKKRVLRKLHKIHRKTPVPEFPFLIKLQSF